MAPGLQEPAMRRGGHPERIGPRQLSQAVFFGLEHRQRFRGVQFDKVTGGAVTQNGGAVNAPAGNGLHACNCERTLSVCTDTRTDVMPEHVAQVWQRYG